MTFTNNLFPFVSFIGQYFTYLIVLDFESTCWKDKKMNYGPEISEEIFLESIMHIA